MTKGTEAALRDGGSEELSAFQLDWQEHAKSSAKWQGGLYTTVGYNTDYMKNSPSIIIIIILNPAICIRPSADHRLPIKVKGFGL